MKHFLISLVVATVLTGISYIVGLEAGWITELNWLEVFSVFTSYSCTYLCVQQSRWNYPIGAASTIALTFLFLGGGLISSAILNGYLSFVLIYGYFYWREDSNTRPVVPFKFDKLFALYVGITVAIWAAMIFGVIPLVRLFFEFDTSLAWTDGVILAGSILAQIMLDRKNIGNWYVWAIVNVFAIYTYFEAGLYLVAFQFVFFLLNTIYGWISWKKTIKPNKDSFNESMNELVGPPNGKNGIYDYV